MHTYLEIICEAPTNRNWTLCDAGRAIHPIRAFLEEPVEMNRGCLIDEFIIGMNHHSVTDITLNRRAGPLAVDPNNRSGESIWRSVYPGDIPIVGDRLGPSRMREDAYKGHHIRSQHHVAALERKSSTKGARQMLLTLTCLAFLYVMVPCNRSASHLDLAVLPGRAQSTADCVCVLLPKWHKVEAARPRAEMSLVMIRRTTLRPFKHWASVLEPLTAGLMPNS